MVLSVGSVLLLGRYLMAHPLYEGVDLLNAAEFAEIDRFLNHALDLRDPVEVHYAVHRHAQIDAAMFFFTIIDRATGETLYRSRNLGNEVLPEETRPLGDHEAQLPVVGPLRIGSYDKGPLRVQIASSLGPIHRLLAVYSWVASGILFVVTVVSVLVGRWLSRATLRPIHDMQQTARRISAENLSERIPLPGPGDELRSLAEFLNETFDRLEASFREIRQFTADASHELKTPLAVLRLQAERALYGKNHDDREEGLAHLLDEVARIQRLVDELLTLARAEGGVLKAHRQPTDTAALIAAFAEDAQLLAEDAGRHFALVANDPGELALDPPRVEQVLRNLLNNALQYAPPGSTVSVAARWEASVWTVTVEDEGPGLPEDDLERVFGRFVRTQNEADGLIATPGTGLGLAICRSLVRLHGGTITATNRQPSGLRVQVRLPVCDSCVNSKAKREPQSSVAHRPAVTLAPGGVLKRR